MAFSRGQKLWCTFAGSGVVLGIISFFQGEKKCAYTSWTTNFTPSVKWDYNWDKREVSSLVRPERGHGDASEENRINEEKQKLKSTASRNLFLIRHGQYELNGKTDADRRLTPLGRLQAEYTGQRLKDLNFSYTSLTQSTMTRAKETAAIIQKFLPSVPLKSCEFICEGAPIPPEPPVGHWKPEQKQFHQEGARIEAAFRKYFHRADSSQTEDSYEILVCHANVIRYFVCRALQFPPEAWLRFSLHHSSITWVAIRPNGRVFVYYVGDCGHIPADKLSTS